MSGINSTEVVEMSNATTISNAAKAISHADFGWTAGSLAKADYAMISAVSADVMFTYDGTDPTATLGHPLVADQIIRIEGNPHIQALKFIRKGSSDATMTITLEKF